MRTDWTPESLAAFERDIADTFNRGEIRSPVHLAGGNERQLIDIFKNIHPQDWVCGTWRSHYHCLLKGVPPAELKEAIVAGRSIALCFPRQRVICSAMVGGIAPIALGLAWGEKYGFGRRAMVHCFIGDMAALSGIANECSRFRTGFELPLRIIVENNRKSVATNTSESWGIPETNAIDFENTEFADGIADLAYDYELTWPHVGTGTFVKFPDAEHKSHGL